MGACIFPETAAKLTQRGTPVFVCTICGRPMPGTKRLAPECPKSSDFEPNPARTSGKLPCIPCGQSVARTPTETQRAGVLAATDCRYFQGNVRSVICTCRVPKPVDVADCERFGICTLHGYSIDGRPTEGCANCGYRVPTFGKHALVNGGS